MSYNENLLFYLLRIGLETETKYDFKFTERPDWKFIFNMSSVQGVLAIVFDGLDFLISHGMVNNDIKPAPALIMQWGINVVKIENVYDLQYSLANDLANIYAEKGIKTIVLKGIASAILYPRPNHRPCGDFDCFLFDNYEKGNLIAEDIGAKVNRDFYKHSHIYYKQLEVENHQFCTPIRGSHKNKVFERELQRILESITAKKINDTNLLEPDPLFNALFLTIHSWGHFLTEEIKLRHVLDWCMLIKKYGTQIDWDKFKHIIEERDKKMFAFAEAITIISHKCYGTNVPPVFNQNNFSLNLANKTLHSVMNDDMSIYNKGYGKWGIRFMSLKNKFANNWKYKEFCEHSSFYNSISNVYYFIFERNPHL